MAFSGLGVAAVRGFESEGIKVLCERVMMGRDFTVWMTCSYSYIQIYSQPRFSSPEIRPLRCPIRLALART